MRLAAAEAGMRCAICDFTLPTATVGLAPCRGGEAASEGFDFRSIAQGDAGAVGLDKVDGAGVNLGRFVCALERELLTFLAGGEQPRAATIGGHADALDASVDAVAVSLGVCTTFEHDNPAALA